MSLNSFGLTDLVQQSFGEKTILESPNTYTFVCGTLVLNNLMIESEYLVIFCISVL